MESIPWSAPNYAPGMDNTQGVCALKLTSVLTVDRT